MRELQIMDTLKLGNNTLIVVNDCCEDMKNGSELLDENGKSHIILSISISNKDNINITNILLEGELKSKKLFV